LRKPGETLPNDNDPNKEGVMKPVQFPKPKPDKQPGANPDGEPDAAPPASTQPAPADGSQPAAPPSTATPPAVKPQMLQTSVAASGAN
ncbi:MAG TPA: hypothetical protein VMQ56_16325, partial [Terracidiphilus sp.]|nr:hypothetical protein [Terracidiphilus sp.]